ncbi:neprilysin-1-like [Dermacentor andersoni]|uniref:neprilysin-1-like n=1 Tax=Dermacentor andersoni TaxID=34620 RepID=UPI003B3A2BC8
MNALLLGVIVLLGLSQAVVVKHYTKPSIRETPKRNVCLKTVCRKKAAEIRRSLNTKADPCEDFYEFVCGGWNKAHPLPKDAARYGVFQELDEQLNKELRAILRKPIHSGTKRQSVNEKAKIAYQSCASNGNPGQRGIYFLGRLLAKNGLGAWPLVSTATCTESHSDQTESDNGRTTPLTELTTMHTTEPATMFVNWTTEPTRSTIHYTSTWTTPTNTEIYSTEPREEWTGHMTPPAPHATECNDTTTRPGSTSNEIKVLLPDYKYVLLTTGMSSLFECSIARDPEKLSSHIIRLDQVTFPLLGRNELMHPGTKRNRALVSAYKTLMATALRIMKPRLHEKMIKVIIENIFAFERELAKRSAPEEDRRNEWKMHNRTTIKVLEAAFPGLPLLDLLNKEFRPVNITLTENEVVSIFASPYFASTTKLLRTTDPCTLYNYVGWRAMQKWAYHASKKFRDAMQAFIKAAYGHEEHIPLWKTCIKFVKTRMSEVVGQLYVRKKFTPHAKRNVQAIVQSMRRTLQRRLKRVTWMDGCTRRRALNKLKEMRAKIGYPPWMLKMKHLERLYKNLGQLSRDDPFLKIYHELEQHDRRRALQDLRRPFNRAHKWANGPAAVNAYYDPEANGIVIPAGILRGVFYKDGLPASINLGAIGFVVGHELIHGFDDYGSQYDAMGSLRRWWSNSTRQRFLKQAQCFVDQYNDIVDKTTNLSLNGRNTIGENIADNAAIRLAFQTYEAMLRRSKVRDERLPGLKKYSGRQLFFISNALMWCANSRKKFLVQQIQYNPHCPSKYRVNVPLSNFPAFSRAFKCGNNSAMHRRKKCVLW